jgi:hypothetical protein
LPLNLLGDTDLTTEKCFELLFCRGAGAITLTGSTSASFGSIANVQ